MTRSGRAGEVYSAFVTGAALEELRTAFALPSNPVEEATGRRYPE